MDFLQLEIFASIASGYTFEETAANFFTSISTISKAIRKLEEEAGITLLDRSRRTASLTKAGKQFLTDSKIILDDYKRALRNLQQFITTPHLSIASVPNLTQLDVSAPIYSFKKAHPDIELEQWDSRNAQTVAESLIAGKVDFIFSHETFTGANNISAKALWYDRMVLCINNEHPLAKCQSISLQEALRFSPAFNKYCGLRLKDAAPGIDFSQFFKFSNIGVIDLVSLVEANLDAIIVTEKELDIFSKENISILPIYDIPKFPVTLAWLNNNPLNASQQLFYDYITDYFSSADHKK